MKVGESTPLVHPWEHFRAKLLTKISITFHVLVQLLRGLFGAISLCFLSLAKTGFEFGNNAIDKALSKERYRLKSDLFIYEALGQYMFPTAEYKLY